MNLLAKHGMKKWLAEHHSIAHHVTNTTQNFSNTTQHLKQQLQHTRNHLTTKSSEHINKTGLVVSQYLDKATQDFKNKHFLDGNTPFLFTSDTFGQPLLSLEDNTSDQCQKGSLHQPSPSEEEKLEAPSPHKPASSSRGDPARGDEGAEANQTNLFSYFFMLRTGEIYYEISTHN